MEADETESLARCDVMVVRECDDGLLRLVGLDGRRKMLAADLEVLALSLVGDGHNIHLAARKAGGEVPCLERVVGHDLMAVEYRDDLVRQSEEHHSAGALTVVEEVRQGEIGDDDELVVHD